MKHSHCEAAIGVMAVKKTTDGIYLFFCHNTDSFVCIYHDPLPKLVSNNVLNVGSCFNDIGRQGSSLCHVSSFQTGQYSARRAVFKISPVGSRPL